MRVARWRRLGLPALLLLLPLVAGVAADVAAGVDTGAKPRAELRAVKHPIAARDFYLKDMQGKRVRLGDFQGKVVLLNFWATWCSSCRKEMPSMEQLYQAYNAKDFVIVGVSVDQGAPGEVQAFAEQMQVTFPILHDRDSLVSRLYDNPGVPSSYLIDRQGRIAYRVLGEYDWFGAPARSAVEALLHK